MTCIVYTTCDLLQFNIGKVGVTVGCDDSEDLVGSSFEVQQNLPHNYSTSSTSSSSGSDNPKEFDEVVAFAAAAAADDEIAFTTVGSSVVTSTTTDVILNNYLNLIPAASTLIYNTNYIIPNNGDNNGGSTPFVGTRNNNHTIVKSSTNTNTNTALTTKTKNTATAITTNYDASYSSISDVKFVNIADDFDLPSASQLTAESSSTSQSNNSTSNRLDCGKKKCFISSLAYPNDLGYLVGNYKDYDKQLIKFIKAWEFTKWIDTQQFNSDDSSNSHSNSNSKQERRYHFYSKERPTIVELSTTTLQKLNSVVYHTNQKTYSPEFYTKSKVAIQKVHKVNINEMLFFGCFSHNYDRYLEEKNKFFLKNNNNHNHNNNVVDVNLNTTNYFSNNLIDSIQIMKRLLQLQPKMFTDFQVVFDSNGYVYFLDVETQYELTARWKIDLKEKQQDCLQKIDGILK
ncbi:hypothetical protein FRACYDRAFT_245897 [Fragilariopsis cylindrus CCMP1102]|uniref:Uncharacterized protein n=1 Tax=Fragilariopsis cylindrus CCMP1102 TaxID=635003 RepID=A0A1E7EZM5_9STRA|nr:hypothetical protein FRACYDRAFT_245897 [Fragilariopsis cylindrus CCMP1102]|eukprot:OEU11402.1 hypothetical protein FRACYDRAFT_245897 [Fragilariopsis cylindrus CCMP1102]